MSSLTPEGKLKNDKCKPLAKRLGLLWWNVEGKAINGIPDTCCGLYPPGSGAIWVEFKRPSKEPTEQQWKRINEARAAGWQADWCDSFERFCELIGYELDL